MDAEPVVVVGAGPVGLANALALRAADLPVLVVEAEPERRIRPGSRAIFVHRESLQLLESIYPGLGHQIAGAGLAWRIRRTTFRGRDVYRRTFDPLPADRLPPSTSLPQVRTEDVLLAACRDAGVRFRWQSPVTGVAVDEAGVELAVAGAERLRSRYVVAADGSRSAVRAALGIAMEGSRSEAPFVIVDVAEPPEPASSGQAGPMPRERVFHYEHPGVGRRNVLLMPFAGGWRVDLQCRADDDPAEFADPEGVRRWLSRVIDPRYADDVRWVSTYRFLQVVADRFADPHGRVLLVGEAAHLFAPFGARGMNSGIADATSAAEAVRAGLRHGHAEAGRGAVERFAADRRAAAQYNRAAAGQALAHMQARTLGIRVKRRLAAAIAPRSVRAGHWLDTAPYGPRVGRPGAPGKY